MRILSDRENVKKGVDKMTETTKNFLKLSNSLYKLCSRKEMIQRQCTNIGRMECELLNYLNNVSEPVCMNDLSREMKVSHSRITRIIDTLVKKKLVKRFPSKLDRRSWLAEIADKGRQASDMTIKNFIQIQEDLIESLPKDKVQEIFKNIQLYFETYNNVLDAREKEEK